MAGPEPRCLLHIGVPKTGSTALQQFLSVNAAVLARAGWSYPDVSRRGWGHHDLAFLLGDGYPDWAKPQPRGLDELAADLATACRDSIGVILSSENFYLFADPLRTRDLLVRSGLHPGSIRIIVYLRRQDDMHLSWYNQAVKAQGYAGTLEESIRATAGTWDYAARLEPWQAAFGGDNLVIRVYPSRHCDDGPQGFDVRRDFLTAAGIDPTEFKFGVAAPNVRLNRDLLEFQRLINRLPLPAVAKRAYHRELMALTTATDGSPLFADQPLLDAAGRRELLERHGPGNTALARRYLGRDELFPADAAEDCAGPAQADAWDGLTPAKLAMIVGWLLVSRDAEGTRA